MKSSSMLTAVGVLCLAFGVSTLIKADKDAMADMYGAGVTAKEVLKDHKVAAPIGMRAFPLALGRYSSRNATE